MMIDSQLPVELQQILESGKIPNAMLFTGNEGTGRRDAALLFARALNCTGREMGKQNVSPCNQCISCRKMISGLHPDIIMVTPENNRIRIPRIREMCLLIAVKPHEAQWRMVLIEEAETMGPEAANALLKTLEEPPGRTFFVLLAKTVATLLPTLLSRCSVFRFLPPSSEELCRALVETHGVAPEVAEITSIWADGSLDRALRYSGVSNQENDPDWLKRRSWLIREISSLIQEGISGNPTLFSALPLAETLSRDTGLLNDSLAVIRSWLRDIAVAGNCPDRVINFDFRDLLDSVARSVSPERAVSWIKDLHTAETGLRLNTVTRTTLEHFFLKLGGVRA